MPDVINRGSCSAEEFEAAYAARSGVTVKTLHWAGRYAEPHQCEDDICEGWVMGHQWEDALVEDQLRHPPEAGR